MSIGVCTQDEQKYARRKAQTGDFPGRVPLRVAFAFGFPPERLALFSRAMRCIVTAGPTFEPLDQVRRLTNHSTGRLGSELTNYLNECGHEVTLLIGQQATWRGERNAARVETFTTTDNLRLRLRALADESWDAVLHAAAVSDFTFGKAFRRDARDALHEVQSGKLSTRGEPLIVELIPTAKIISELRGWFPRATIVGWKYEVDGTREEVIEKASRQIFENQTDACVANGPAYGEGFGLVTPEGCQLVADAPTLYGVLDQFICT
jgi:phosphopantothenoylcysteine decarboxylase/phosphopantothenate--cysteine ligase